MHERDKAHLTLAVEDARDEAEQETEAIRETYQPIVDSLNEQVKAKRQEAGAEREKAKKADDPEPHHSAADRLDAEAEALEEQSGDVRGRIRDLRDKTRQLRIVEAVQAQDQCGPMFEDFEVRARHDLPGSQYVAKSVTEQCQSCMGDLLKDRVTALRKEIAELTKTLDARVKT